MQSNDTIISSRVALPTPVLSGNLGMTKDKVDGTSGQGGSLQPSQVLSSCHLPWHSPPSSTLAMGQQLPSMLGMMCISCCLRLPEGIALLRV